MFDPKAHDKGARKGKKVYWPSMRYAPGWTDENPVPYQKIFQREEDVPEGWVKHPSELRVKAVAEAPAAPAAAPARAGRKKDASKPVEKTRRDELLDLLAKAEYDPKDLAALTDANLETLWADEQKAPSTDGNPNQ